MTAMDLKRKGIVTRVSVIKLWEEDESDVEARRRGHVAQYGKTCLTRVQNVAYYSDGDFMHFYFTKYCAFKTWNYGAHGPSKSIVHSKAN